MISGLDASNVNGALDWPRAKRDYRLSFAIVKATEGTGFLDPDFPASWQALKELGLARGAYHFAHPANGPVAEAEFFLAYVSSHGLEAADFLALDLEVSDGLPPSAVASYARQFCAHLQMRASRIPPVYTFPSFIEAGNCEGLGGYPLWLADWSSPPGSPRVLAPWRSWALHQYSSQGVDLDVANYPDVAAMTAALGKPRPSPPPPKPVPEDDVYLSPLQLPPFAGAETAAVTIDLSSAGTFKAIGFSSDWSKNGEAQPALRVAVHSVHHDFTQIIGELAVPAKGKAVVKFTEPDVDYISVMRASASTALVSAGT